MKAHERLEKEYQYGKRSKDIERSEELSFRPHILQELPLLFLTLGSIAAGIYGSILYPASVQKLTITEFDSFSLIVPIPFFALLPVVLSLLLLHRLFDAMLVVGLDHICLIEGILSFRTIDTRIDYENVRGIEIDRSLYQRIFKLGAIRIGSSMHSGVEIEMKGIKNPARLRLLIEDRIRGHFEKLSRNTMVERVRKSAQ